MSELDQIVRRADEDRWLASRFAPADARAALIALYALNHEIARTAEVVTQEGLGLIRLNWWREGVANAAQKKPNAQPILQALPPALKTPAARAVLDVLIDARAADFQSAPFPTWDHLDAYLDATAGGVMRLALMCCAADVDEQTLQATARAWGGVGLMRAGAVWAARGRTFLPTGEDAHAMVARTRAAYERARARVLPSEAFPALGYVALVDGYLRQLERGAVERPLLARQLRLIASAANGRV